MSDSAPRRHEIKLGSITTSFLTAGPEGAPELMLVHDGAFGGDAASCWGGVIECLSADFHLLAPDLLGYGQSEKVAFFNRSPYEPRIEQVEALCTHLGLRSVHFMGASFGGSVMLRAAAAQAWPMASGISVCGTGGPFRLDEGRRILEGFEPTIESVREITQMLITDSVDDYEDHVHARFANGQIPGHWESLVSARLRGPSHSRPSADDYPGSLAACDQPLLLIEGARDQLLEPGWSQKLADACESAERVVIDTGHCPNIDAVGVLVAIVRRFLDRHAVAA